MSIRTVRPRALAAVAMLVVAALLATFLPSPAMASPVRPAPRPEAFAAVASAPGQAPSNTDSTQFHLLWYGKTKKPPAGQQGVKVGQQLADFYTGYVISNALNQIPANLIVGLGTIYSIVTGIIAIVDFVETANGGTRGQMERYSGYCRDVWETYSKVRIRSAFASFSVDMIWESVSRAETAYIRYLFQTYLGRSPSCDEMRWHLGYMNDRMWVLNEKHALDTIACSAESKNRNKPDPNNPAKAFANKLAWFCALKDNASQPHGFHWWQAYRLADWHSHHNCTDASMWGKDTLRQRIMFADPDGDIDDVKASVGRPQEYDDMAKYAIGRMINHITVYDTYLQYTSKYPAWDWAAVVEEGIDSEDPAVRDYVCNLSRVGPWIQEGHRNQVLAESDKVLRNFFDLAARKPLGTDVLAQYVGSGNLWNVFLSIAKPPNCGTDQRWYESYQYKTIKEWRPNGYMCKAGDKGHTVLGMLLSAIA